MKIYKCLLVICLLLLLLPACDDNNSSGTTDADTDTDSDTDSDADTDSDTDTDTDSDTDETLCVDGEVVNPEACSAVCANYADESSCSAINFEVPEDGADWSHGCRWATFNEVLNISEADAGVDGGSGSCEFGETRQACAYWSCGEGCGSGLLCDENEDVDWEYSVTYFEDGGRIFINSDLNGIVQVAPYSKCKWEGVPGEYIFTGVPECYCPCFD